MNASLEKPLTKTCGVMAIGIACVAIGSQSQHNNTMEQLTYAGLTPSKQEEVGEPFDDHGIEGSIEKDLGLILLVGGGINGIRLVGNDRGWWDHVRVRFGIGKETDS